MCWRTLRQWVSQFASLARDGVMAIQTASNSVPVSHSEHAAPSFSPALRAKPRVLWPWPVFLLGIAAIVGVWYARPYIKPTASDRVQRDLSELRKLVDRAPADFGRAVTLGERILEQGERFPQFVGEANYLVGCLHLKKAEEMAVGTEGPELQ